MDGFPAFLAFALGGAFAFEVKLFIAFVLLLNLRRLLYGILKRRGSALEHTAVVAQ